ncbi:uncharacterized protein LOC144093660 isoform X3 [Amblyomma americanum]
MVATAERASKAVLSAILRARNSSQARDPTHRPPFTALTCVLCCQLPASVGPCVLPAFGCVIPPEPFMTFLIGYLAQECSDLQRVAWKLCKPPSCVRLAPVTRRAGWEICEWLFLCSAYVAVLMPQHEQPCSMLSSSADTMAAAGAATLGPVEVQFVTAILNIFSFVLYRVVV